MNLKYFGLLDGIVMGSEQKDSPRVIHASKLVETSVLILENRLIDHPLRLRVRYVYM